MSPLWIAVCLLYLLGIAAMMRSMMNLPFPDHAEMSRAAMICNVCGANCEAEAHAALVVPAPEPGSAGAPRTGAGRASTQPTSRPAAGMPSLTTG